VNGAITGYHQRMTGLLEPYPTDFIISPVPLEFWHREKVAQNHDDRWLSTEWSGLDFGYGYANSEATQCKLPDLARARLTNSQLDAFLFWSRAPFATRAEDGSVILYDARFYDPRARDRFSVALPDAVCEELPEG
jgi:inner membrane protein